jgi:hypothetical protein
MAVSYLALMAVAQELQCRTSCNTIGCNAVTIQPIHELPETTLPHLSLSMMQPMVLAVAGLDTDNSPEEVQQQELDPIPTQVPADQNNPVQVVVASTWGLVPMDPFQVDNLDQG